MKILLIEDNPDLSNSIGNYLNEEGTLCEFAFTYNEAVDKIVSYGYDIIILDIMLPDGNGLNILKEIQQQRLNPGILVISAKNSLDDKLSGLNLGADDYLTKPFDLPELNARIKAIYRRKNFDSRKVVEFNEITIDTESFEVTAKDQKIDLTVKEFEILMFFLSNKNKVITKQSIAEHLWGEEADMYDSYDFVYQHIKNLRKKLLGAGAIDYIDTIYGLGYKFNTHKS